MKYLGIKLTKEVKDLYIKTIILGKRRSKKVSENGNIYPALE